MNDSSEVRHGWECLAYAYNESDAGQRLKSILESLVSEIEKDFNALWRHILQDTYIACFSEHKDEEDNCGRLSMWRAYGVPTGVALVVNSSTFFATDTLKAYISPVAYYEESGFAQEFGKVVNNIEGNRDLISTQGRDTIKVYVLRFFLFAAVCTKHPGFAEEIEWRVMHYPWWEKSAHLHRATKVIQGVAQPIYQFPLKDIPKEVVGLEIPALIDRIIIGPTRDQQPIWEAFKDELGAAGFSEPHKRVVLSPIPLKC